MISGTPAVIHAPMYGMKRRIAASRPHSGALGMPTKVRPIPTEIPISVLMKSWTWR